MTIHKTTAGLGMPWEENFAYSQAVKVGDTIYVAGQGSHDDEGKPVGPGDMEAQMRRAYANIAKVLAQFGAALDHVVEETIFVTDMEAAMAVKGKVRAEVFAGRIPSADTIVQIERLASPNWMIEIRCVARL
jgi:enamine deaminase RidA (YjgF/YER057c/UK114 family)